MMVLQEMIVVEPSAAQHVMEVVVKLRSDMAPTSTRYAGLAAALARLGLQLEQSGGPGPGGYAVALAGRDLAAGVIDQVRKLDGVEAAFIKSRGDIPTGEVPK